MATGDPTDPRATWAAHWEAAYERSAARPSWYQREPGISLALVEVLGIDRGASVIDVGGGGSALPPALAGRGFTDLTVLDVSERALAHTAERLGRDATAVTLVNADVRAWTPPRRFDLWHDRATLHFFSDPGGQALYVRTLKSAVAEGGAVIIGVFASDGPEHCSGLPVRRYSPSLLCDLLGDQFTMVEQRRELHVTPAGAEQWFQWVAFRRATGRAGAEDASSSAPHRGAPPAT